MATEMDEVLDLVEDLGTTWHIDPEQVHALGFSNGGLFVGAGAFAHSDRIATASVLGYGWGGQFLAVPGRPIPTQFIVGDQDSFAAFAVDSEGFLAGQGHDTRLVVAPGVGHSFSGLSGVVFPSDVVDWMVARPL
jgi:pimeloyl-ACP methyl ester carboxylesterase